MSKRDYNTERPLVMHIDLNSCFATIEQQARPMLRGRPVAIVNRRTEHTAIVTASYEAKARGVKVGMRFKEAARLAPGLVMLESDPAKYRFVYHKLMGIMKDYSPNILMKSIDEGVIDFHDTTELIRARSLEDIGQEIKQRLRSEVGTAMRCNVGIGPNRFLAKTAAGLHKPDGLDIIDHTNLRTTLASLKLTDLTGIAGRNEQRLNRVGIYTPLEFIDADVETLHKMVFRSICGDQWHQRLRGYEVDDVEHDIKTVGRQYVLESHDLSRTEIIQRLHHLCESVGSRLRSQEKAARGVLVYAKTYDRQYWHARSLCQLPFFSDRAIYAQAARLFAGSPTGAIREIGISCYHLCDDAGDQLTLFGDELARGQQITSAIDTINRRFGERTIHAADTLGTGFYVKQKVPFGSTRYL
jgi:DNA polymerase-4